eukprot:Selendium_serpulae@DN4827_c0_g1_i1.p2
MDDGLVKIFFEKCENRSSQLVHPPVTKKLPFVSSNRSVHNTSIGSINSWYLIDENEGFVCCLNGSSVNDFRQPSNIGAWKWSRSIRPRISWKHTELQDKNVTIVFHP